MTSHEHRRAAFTADAVRPRAPSKEQKRKYDAAMHEFEGAVKSMNRSVRRTAANAVAGGVEFC